jgi:hypothetical protein
MIEKIPNIAGRVCTVLLDTGAQISLVTHQYAREAGFKGRPASIQTSEVGTGNKNRSKVLYRVLLKKRDGKVLRRSWRCCEHKFGEGKESVPCCGRKHGIT